MYVASLGEREREIGTHTLEFHHCYFENIIVFDVGQQHCAIFCDDCVFYDVDTSKHLIKYRVSKNDALIMHVLNALYILIPLRLVLLIPLFFVIEQILNLVK